MAYSILTASRPKVTGALGQDNTFVPVYAGFRLSRKHCGRHAERGDLVEARTCTRANDVSFTVAGQRKTSQREPSVEPHRNNSFSNEQTRPGLIDFSARQARKSLNAVPAGPCRNALLYPRINAIRLLDLPRCHDSEQVLDSALALLISRLDRTLIQTIGGDVIDRHSFALLV